MVQWLKWLLGIAGLLALLAVNRMLSLPGDGAVSQEDLMGFRTEIQKEVMSLNIRMNKQELVDAAQTDVDMLREEFYRLKGRVDALEEQQQVVPAQPVTKEETTAAASVAATVKDQSGASLLFEPGSPDAMYIPPLAEAPPPTAFPPPGKVWTEEERVSPIIPLAHMRSMRTLGQCALVGSHSALRNRGLGSEIDSHDVVIRVNDAVNFSKDVGFKTDIYFATMCKLHGGKKDIALGKGGGHTSLRTYGMKRGPGCNYFCKETGVTKGHEAACPFKAYVISGINSSECTTTMKSRGYHGIQEVELNACYPTGYVNDAWSTEIQDIRRNQALYWGRPTTGFHAIIVFGYLCDKLTLYGFGLDVPGHFIQDVHHMGRERLLLHKLVSGTLPLEDYPPVLRNTLRHKAASRSIRFAFTE